ncbi:hypothetical protein ACIQ57_08885 [Lysinibacillus xylanilyticus]|uniref:hypothetical protein n=1 Tax=Lysinibacillus xylanilyticus TaxID=582475 RepID=UPI00382CB12A
MISELDKAEFSTCRKLLNEQGQLEAIAVVENLNPGRIFEDDINNPARSERNAKNYEIT